MSQSMLLVDDDKAVAAALFRILRRQDYQLHIAHSAQEALELLESSPVQVVLSDFRMPVMNGLELLTEVKQRWPEITRLMLSGQSDYESTEEALAGGVVDFYMTKPWKNEELLDVVGQSFEGKFLHTRTGFKPQNSGADQPQEAKKTTLKSITLFDAAVLEKLRQGAGEETFSTLLDVFSKDSRKRAAELEVAAKTADYESLKRQLHTLGSSAALYGLMRCSVAARQLEKLCDTDAVKVCQQVAAFNRLLEESLQQLPDVASALQ